VFICRIGWSNIAVMALCVNSILGLYGWWVHLVLEYYEAGRGFDDVEMVEVIF